MSLGGYLPTGGISYANNLNSLDLVLGVEYGMEFSYFFNRYIGVGVYYDGTTILSEIGEGYDSTFGYFEDTVSVDTSIIGTFISFNAPLGRKANFVGSARIGLASSEIELEEEDAYGIYTLSDEVTSVVFSLEGGFLFDIWKFDIGGGVRYTFIPIISSTLEDDTYSLGYTDYEVDLSGLSILFNFGFKF
jgi:hypothetical protein